MHISRSYNLDAMRIIISLIGYRITIGTLHPRIMHMNSPTTARSLVMQKPPELVIANLCPLLPSRAKAFRKGVTWAVARSMGSRGVPSCVEETKSGGMCSGPLMMTANTDAQSAGASSPSAVRLYTSVRQKCSATISRSATLKGEMLRA